jgi:hypothetical protein
MSAVGLALLNVVTDRCWCSIAQELIHNEATTPEPTNGIPEPTNYAAFPSVPGDEVSDVVVTDVFRMSGPYRRIMANHGCSQD